MTKKEDINDLWYSDQDLKNVLRGSGVQTPDFPIIVSSSRRQGTREAVLDHNLRLLMDERPNPAADPDQMHNVSPLPSILAGDDQGQVNLALPINIDGVHWAGVYLYRASTDEPLHSVYFDPLGGEPSPQLNLLLDDIGITADRRQDISSLTQDNQDDCGVLVSEVLKKLTQNPEQPLSERVDKTIKWTDKVRGEILKGGDNYDILISQLRGEHFTQTAPNIGEPNLSKEYSSDTKSKEESKDKEVEVPRDKIEKNRAKDKLIEKKADKDLNKKKGQDQNKATKKDQNKKKGKGRRGNSFDDSESDQEIQDSKTPNNQKVGQNPEKNLLKDGKKSQQQGTDKATKAISSNKLIEKNASQKITNIKKIVDQAVPLPKKKTELQAQDEKPKKASVGVKDPSSKIGPPTIENCFRKGQSSVLGRGPEYKNNFSERAAQLDSLSKLFGLRFPYTAIAESQDKPGEISISLSGASIDQDKDTVEKIFSALKGLSEDEITKDKLQYIFDDSFKNHIEAGFRNRKDKSEKEVEDLQTKHDNLSKKGLDIEEQVSKLDDAIKALVQPKKKAAKQTKDSGGFKGLNLTLEALKESTLDDLKKLSPEELRHLKTNLGEQGKENKQQQEKTSNLLNTAKTEFGNVNRELSFFDIEKYKTAKNINIKINDKDAEQIKKLHSSLKTIDIIKTPPGYEAGEFIHVDVVLAKGIAAKNKDNPQVAVNMGLAHTEGESPGCCSGCTVALGSIEFCGGPKVYRTADYPFNFPPASYMTHPEMTEAERSEFAIRTMALFDMRIDIDAAGRGVINNPQKTPEELASRPKGVQYMYEVVFEKGSVPDIKTPPRGTCDSLREAKKQLEESIGELENHMSRTDLRIQGFSQNIDKITSQWETNKNKQSKQETVQTELDKGDTTTERSDLAGGIEQSISNAQSRKNSAHDIIHFIKEKAEHEQKSSPKNSSVGNEIPISKDQEQTKTNSQFL